MPDIDFERITVNMVPSGELPVFHASQYETARPFIADLFWGDTEFAPGDDSWAEIDIRKVDGNIIIMSDDVSIEGNVVSVVLPQQAVTCIGKNIGQIKIYSAEDQLVATLNFILEVQPDPLAGGVDSETAIDNLESQIAAIVPEVIGDDYYNKTEVDTLLNGKADAATTYTKTEVNNALALKANSSDLATVATTGDYDDLLNKPTIPAAQIQSDYAQADNTKLDYIKNKPDIAGMIAAAIDNILPIVSDSGAIATINVGLERVLKTITVDPLATQVVRCGLNLWDEEWESGIWTNTGEKYVEPRSIRCANYIKVVPNSTIYMYFSNTYTSGLIIRCLNANKEFISTVIQSSRGIVNIPNNCEYIVFCTVSADEITTYGDDISINRPASDTAYHEYNGNTYPVADIDTITTLNGVNNIFADAGDVSVSAYDSIQHYIDNQ
jgi:hypothetical protein